MKEKYYEYKEKMLNAKTAKELREIKEQFSLGEGLTREYVEKLLIIYITRLEGVIE